MGGQAADNDGRQLMGRELGGASKASSAWLANQATCARPVSSARKGAQNKHPRKAPMLDVKTCILR
mgnify:CR=1 FL=1